MFPGVMSSTSNQQQPFVVSFDMIFVGDRIQVFLDGEADRGNPMSMGQGWGACCIHSVWVSWFVGGGIWQFVLMKIYSYIFLTVSSSPCCHRTLLMIRWSGRAVHWKIEGNWSTKTSILTPKSRKFSELFSGKLWLHMFMLVVVLLWIIGVEGLQWFIYISLRLTLDVCTLAKKELGGCGGIMLR